MFKTVFAVLAALVLQSCGGGGGAESLTTSLATEHVQLKKASPGSSLLAEPASVVNTPTTKGSLREIGATSDGGYVVAWYSGSSSIYIQAYDSVGAEAGALTKLNLEIVARTPDDSLRAIQSASVAVLNDGTVAVVYRVTRDILVNGYVETVTGLYFQRFDANGNLLMGETEIVSQQEPPQNPTAPFISGYSVRALSDGGFVVAWTINYYFTGSPVASSLTLRWFDSQGQPQGSPVQVGTFSGLELTSMEADAHGGVTLSTSYLDAFFHPHYAVWHYDANHILQPIVAAGLSPMLLLPLESGYVLFTSGTGGATAQILDSKGNPSGTPTQIPFMPVAAREFADGSYVAVGSAGGTFVAQRFAADGTPLGEPVTIDSNGVVPRIAALADTGFAAAWTGPGAAGATDVYAQRLFERFSDRKKACLDSAKGLKGQDRKAFVDACLA